MLEKYKTDEEIISWLEEEYACPFTGWDFTYLKGRRISLGKLPWDYEILVREYIQRAENTLDMDTGGGEALAKILSTTPHIGKVSATEAYAPNVSIARKKLAEFSVEVHDMSESQLMFGDATFDLVVDRHGGSLSPQKIFQLLQPGGYYVTQQVGNQTNKELRALFNSSVVLDDDWPHNAEDANQVFTDTGFVVKAVDSGSYPVRFVDAGALVRYLKAIPWEVPDFSVRKFALELIKLHHGSISNGYAVDTTFHAYKLVAHKP